MKKTLKTKPETLYEKSVSPSGRVRYIPTGTMWPTNYFEEGTYVVRVKPKKTSIVSIINPAKAEVVAAIEEARDVMTKKLMDLSRYAPPQNFNSDVHKNAYEQYEKAFTDEGLDPYPLTLSMESVWSIIDAALETLKENMEKDAHNKS